MAAVKFCFLFCLADIIISWIRHRFCLCISARIFLKSLVKAPVTKGCDRIGCYSPSGFQESESWICCTQMNWLQEPLFGKTVPLGFQLHPISWNMLISWKKLIINWDAEPHDKLQYVFASGVGVVILSVFRHILSTLSCGINKMGLKGPLVVAIT